MLRTTFGTHREYRKQKILARGLTLIRGAPKQQPCKLTVFLGTLRFDYELPSIETHQMYQNDNCDLPRVPKERDFHFTVEGANTHELVKPWI